MSIQNCYRKSCCIVSSKATKTPFVNCKWYYPQVSNIRHTLVGNEIADHPDIVEAWPVGAGPTTSSFLTWHLASMDWAKTTPRRDEKHLSFWVLVRLILEDWQYLYCHILSNVILSLTPLITHCVLIRCWVCLFFNAQLQGVHKGVHLTPVLWMRLRATW